MLLFCNNNYIEKVAEVCKELLNYYLTHVKEDKELEVNNGLIIEEIDIAKHHQTHKKTNKVLL